MTRHLRPIGFSSQRVRLQYLERTANLLLAGNNRQQIKVALDEFLHDRLSGGGGSDRGSRQKMITILMNAWVTTPDPRDRLLSEARQLLQNLRMDQHIVVHWGAIMTAYPFWSIVAGTTGRLLRLQGATTAAQVQRRMREELGDREIVNRASRTVVRSFVDWGVLDETQEKGVYKSGRIRTVTHKPLVTWLIEALLVANGNGSGSLKAISQSPALFPFHIILPSAKELEQNDRLEIFHHGFEDEIVTLRRKSQSASPDLVS